MSYSISIPKIHTNNNNATIIPNSYHLYIAGYGGHIGLTPISDEAASYWKDLDVEIFGQHLLLDDKPSHIDLNGKELGGVQQEELNTMAGPELHDGLMIDLYDRLNGQRVWGYEIGEALTEPFKHEVDQDYYRDLKDGTSYAHFRTFDAISNVYLLETYEPFDPALLELDFVWFSNSKILRSVRYNDQDVKFDHQCGHAVQAPIASVLLRTMH